MLAVAMSHSSMAEREENSSVPRYPAGGSPNGFPPPVSKTSVHLWHTLLAVVMSQEIATVHCLSTKAELNSFSEYGAVRPQTHELWKLHPTFCTWFLQNFPSLSTACDILR